MTLEAIYLPSVGPLVIAVVAILLSVFQWQIYARRSRNGWDFWGALVSLSTAAYAAATFIQYNAISDGVLRLASQIQFTMLAFIIFSLFRYSASYLRLKSKWLEAVGISMSCLFTILIWATDLVSSSGIVSIDFLLLRRPYRQAGLGPLGPVFLTYLGMAGIGLVVAWFKYRSRRKTPLAMMTATILFMVLGILDALSNVWTGFPPIIPSAEYGFLGFCVGIMAITLSDRDALFDLAKSRQQDLETAMKLAERANAAKSEFLANMSHELRTPLNHIIGFTDVLLENGAGPLNASQQEYLKDVAFSGRHLLSLIDDILDLSKVEAGKLELHCTDLTLGPLLQRCAIMVKEKAMKRGIEVTIDAAEAPLQLQADERRLRQVLYNLLSNAVKFTPDGGRVSMSARHREQAGSETVVEITVTDSGIGIEKENLERIFQPFVQGDSDTGSQQEGTGLGLSLSRRLVELHGGKIWAESQGSGRGSTFRVLLPLAPTRMAGCENE